MPGQGYIIDKIPRRFCRRTAHQVKGFRSLLTYRHDKSVHRQASIDRHRRAPHSPSVQRPIPRSPSVDPRPARREASVGLGTRSGYYLLA